MSQAIVHGDPWAPMQLAGAYINNPWGLSVEQQNDRKYVSAFISREDGVYLTCNIPDQWFDRSRVLAYPQFYIGQKDRNLPLSDAPFSPVPWQVLEHGLQFCYSRSNDFQRNNVASEIFLIDGDEPIVGGDDDNRAFEVMVWLDAPQDPDISLGGVVRESEKWAAFTSGSRDDYLAFVLKPDYQVEGCEQVRATINWPDVLNIAADIAANTPGLKNFNPRWKVHAIESGVEMWSGAVDMKFSGIKLLPAVSMSPGFEARDVSVNTVTTPHPYQEPRPLIQKANTLGHMVQALDTYLVQWGRNDSLIHSRNLLIEENISILLELMNSEA